MSIYALKPAFQNLLRPLVKRLYAWGVTANQVTLLACMVSVLLGVWLCVKAATPVWFWLLPAWLFVRMALNAIDGMLAREFNQKSRLGAYLNELTDVIADAALMLAFAFVAPLDAWGGLLVYAAIWLAVLTEFSGVLAQAVQGVRHYHGPMGKSDRAFVFGVLGALYAWLGYLPAWTWWLLCVVAVLLVLTCFRRLRAGLV